VILKPLLLKEKGFGDEVIKLEKGFGDEVDRGKGMRWINKREGFLLSAEFVAQQLINYLSCNKIGRFVHRRGT
jgi:hypothetical protein